MAPLTHDRHTPFIEQLTQVALPVAAKTTIYKNALVCLTPNGFAVPAANTAGFVLAGVSEGDGQSIRGTSTVFNDTIYDGAVRVLVRRMGAYLFHSKDALSPVHVGKPLYVIDDQTVTLNKADSNIFAGTLARYESPAEAWVDIYPATAASFMNNP